MTNFNHQHFLITGITSGIGYSLATSLHDQGALISGIARDYSSFDLPVENALSLDLSDLNALSSALQHEPIFGFRYQGLVLNAGIGRFGALEQFSETQIQQLVNVNLTSNLFLLRHFLPIFKKHKGGDIVLIGSESALQGGPMGAVYSATKFAIRGLAQSLRHECAKAGVRVILVNPGPVNTGFFDELDFKPADGRESSLEPSSVAQSIMSALKLPRESILEEINLQVSKRVFVKK